MARIAHLSDLHFGAHDPAVVAGAEAWLAEARPDLVVISGDFTQRARSDEYRNAAAFLDRVEALGIATLGVPRPTCVTRPRLHSAAATSSGSNGVMPNEMWSIDALRTGAFNISSRRISICR